MKDKQKPNKVKRPEADEVFRATATEPLRKFKRKTPAQKHPAELERIRREAEALVEKGKKRVKKNGDQYS